MKDLKYECKQADAEVGLKIKKQRKALRITQKEMATAIGVTYQQVQKYESGHSRISMSTFMNICGELKLSPAAFFDNLSLAEDSTPCNKTEAAIEKKALSILRSIKNIKVQSRVLNLLEVLAADFNQEEK